MFQNPFSFKGRITRKEFFISNVFFGLIWFIISFLNFRGTSELIFFPVICLWFLFSQGAKRCHDRGNSGWFQLIPFYSFWMLFGKGNIGANEYGDCSEKNKINNISLMDVLKEFKKAPVEFLYSLNNYKKKQILGFSMLIFIVIYMVIDYLFLPLGNTISDIFIACLLVYLLIISVTEWSVNSKKI